MIGEALDYPQCSRAGCRTEASWNVEWRNPKIHTVDRVKVWLACDEHVDYLREFLESRNFPVRPVPITADAPGASGAR